MRAIKIFMMLLGLMSLAMSLWLIFNPAARALEMHPWSVIIMNAVLAFIGLSFPWIKLGSYAK